MSDTAATSTNTPAITVSGLTRSFGGLTAVDVNHLEIQPNRITALIGPNGAGKTTLFNLISGFDHPTSGSWQLFGQDMTGVAPFKVARSGLVRTFQLTKSLGRLSVLENMMLGTANQTGESLWASMIQPLWGGEEAASRKRALELLDKFKLDHVQDEFAANLSGGQRKLLEMARALMADPQVILLDEPMAGVNPALTQSLLGHIQGIRDEGRTVVFVEHDMDMVREISDEVVVMAEGQLIAQGSHGEVAANPRVISAYLGQHYDEDLSNLDSTNPTDDAGVEDSAPSSPGAAAASDHPATQKVKNDDK